MSLAPKRRPRGSFRNVLALVSTLIMAASLAACGGSDSANGQTQTVTVGLSSAMGPSWAAFAVAQEQGYFADEDLAVELQFPGASGDVLQSMAVGRTDIGAPAAESIFAAAEQGQDVQMTYAWTRGAVSAMSVMDDSPIESFEDLRGTTIGVPSLSSGTKVLADASLESVGIDPSEVKYIAVGTGSAALDALQRDRIDALMLYDTEFASMRNSGADIRTFLPEEFTDLFSTTFATSDAWLDENSDVMQRFGRAWTKASVWTLANPEGAIRTLWKQFPETKTSADEEQLLADQVAILEARAEFLTLGDPGADNSWGEYPATAVENWTKFASDYGITSQKLEPEGLYTNEFVSFYNDFDHEEVELDAQGS
jgi:NitT/TauT family transport system substrate-binding protein